MNIPDKVAIAGLAMTILIGSVGASAARINHRHFRHYAHRHEIRNARGGILAGEALGLLGVGIAGAAAADNGYSYPFPAYGSGGSGFGYYGPGYGYYGY